MKPAMDREYVFGSTKRPVFASEAERLEAYSHVFNSNIGKRVLKDILKECGLFASVPAGGVELINHINGARAIGYHILNILNGEGENDGNSR